MSSPLGFMENLDFLGGKMSFKIDGRSTFKIPFGGFLTIIAALIYFYFFLNIITPFLARNIPRISLDNKKQIDPNAYGLNEHNFYTAYKIYLSNSDSDIYNLLNVTASFQTITTNVNEATKQIEQINTRNSTVEDFFSESYVFYSQKLQNAKAFVFGDDMNLRGSSISEIETYVKIEVSLWNLSSDYLTEVENTLNNNGANLQIFYSDLSLSLSNYATPYTHFISYYSDTLSFKLSKSASIEFAVFNLTTDSAFLFEKNIATKIETQHFITNWKASYRNNNTKNLYSAVLKLNKNSFFYLIYYMKVPELLAILGGIFSILLSIFASLNNYVNDYLLNVKLIENMFNLDRLLESEDNIIIHNRNKELKVIKNVDSSLQEDSKNVIKKNISNLPDLSFSPNSFDKSGEATNVNITIEENLNRKPIKKKPIAEVKIKYKRNPIVKDNFFDTEDTCFTLFLCCLKSKQMKKRYKLYAKAKNYIEVYIDIIKVTKKLLEVDLIKYLILNEDQHKLCNIIGRPFLTLNENRLDKTKFSHSYSSYADLAIKSDYEMKHMPFHEKNKILKIYDKVKKKEQPSVVDRKLILSVQENVNLLKL